MSRRDTRHAKLERKSRKAAKKNRRQSQRQRELQPSYSLLSGMDEAEELLKEGNMDDAAEVLEELQRRYPRRVEMLGLLLEVRYRQQDMWSYQAICQRIVDLSPEDDDVWLALAGAALANGQPSAARRAFNHYLNHWPDSAPADDARDSRDKLDSFLRLEFAALGVSEAEGFELFLLHDEINFHLHQGEYDRVCDSADRLLRRSPTFAPALNNRCEARFRLGRLDLAIADAKRVLELEADNFHALANLTRFLVLSGLPEEAAEVAQCLKAAESDSPDLFVKQAEALSFLGDWSGVIEALEQAETRTPLDGNVDGLLYHLAGVAAANLGKTDMAVKYWKRAIKLKSADSWAQQNLEDSKLPAGEQHGPWAYPIEYWIPTPVFNRLFADMERAGPRAKDLEVRRRVRRFFEAHPNLERLMPLLLVYGEPTAKEFVVRVAALAGLPSILSALRDFAMGRHGADRLRHQAAMVLVEAGVLAPGQHRMWWDGELRDLLLTSYEISPEPLEPLPKDVERLVSKAHDAMHKDDGAAAESLFDEALRLHPDNPTLAYNRAVALGMQGRKDEATSLVREIHARHPDYLFARVRLAEDAVDRHDFETARSLLDPLTSRRRFHHSEYTAFCHAHVHLLSADGKVDSARSWLDLWQRVAPDDPRAVYWKQRLGKRGLLSSFLPKH